ncbi:hypothetical protein C8J56DRAFT_964954 [Mycena floridula]|nr:hypothetical protein C8J56DRAFT_964954 [Mycena floridula]
MKKRDQSASLSVQCHQCTRLFTQTIAMGPPPSSQREPRRSRRSAPSASTSKSPDSDVGPRTPKEIPPRPPLNSNNSSSSRAKRPKQEDLDDTIEAEKIDSIPIIMNPPTNSTPNGRTKRKAKEKEKQLFADGEQPSASNGDLVGNPPIEEEASITRCICDNRPDDPDAGEFMVQCETCNVWQHGLCMGYESEDLLPADDYHCEKCRPDMHEDLLKRLHKRKARHSSTTSHHTAAASRLSRSHSPTHIKQPSKRRNTMNSRDAAFDENLKEILETTAIEAGTVPEPSLNGHNDLEEESEMGPANRKKRRRTDDDTIIPKKRNRSVSTTSDQPPASAHPRDESPQPTKASTSGPPPAPKNSRKRGGRRIPVHETTPVDGDGAVAPPKRQNNGRSRGGAHAKKPPQSTATRGTNGDSHEPASRRNQANGTNGQGTSSNTGEGSRAYRNSHAYAVSQQPLYHSWNLPDYLAHLADQLPTNIPKPLEVRSGRGESVELERGVKVKWPSKRMSVTDMNKRVRALVEWVGREQAGAQDRGRRQAALSEELAKMGLSADFPMDGIINQDMDADYRRQTASPMLERQSRISTDSSQAVKEMETLMSQLIDFQERFGPSVKVRDRDRRTLVAAL